MSKRAGRAVVFDLDGTLLDTAPEITASIAFEFDRRGLAPLTVPQVRALMGRPIEEIIAHGGVPDADLTVAVAGFREHLRQFAGTTSPVFPGVERSLQLARELGFRVGVATTKPSEIARLTLRRARLFDMIDFIQGTDGIPAKPAPDVVLACLRQLGCGRGLMVGDTPDDVTAGRLAGLLTVSVDHGTRTRAELIATKPDVLLNSLTELVPLLPKVWASG